jgi:hypothetical protein
MHRPAPDEYAPFYESYIGKVPTDVDVLELLASDHARSEALLRQAGDETFRYAEGKWSVREVVGHLIDAERVFSFRAAHVARGDGAPLPGMDQEIWASASNAHDRPLAELLAEWSAVRRSTLALFRGLPQEAWDRRGLASGAEVTVRALAAIILGHERHHRQILRQRYLCAPEGPASAP